MNAITSFIKRYPQATFWIIAWLTFLIGNLLGEWLVTAIADSMSGVKTYFSRIVRWRVDIR